MDNKNYWSGDMGIDVVKTATQRITPEEAVGFVMGCQEIYRMINEIDPDVMFFPERGASPIDWSLQQFGELYPDKIRHCVYLPIGTCIDPRTSSEWGPSKPTKLSIVHDAVENLHRSGVSVKKPLLIDEVQSGATITNVVRNLGDVMDGGDLFVIAVQDTRNSWLSRKHAKGYKKIIESKREGVVARVVEMPLFTVDRQTFLNRLFNSSNGYHWPMVEQNIEAQLFIKGLVLIVMGIQNQISSPDPEIATWYQSVVDIVGIIKS